MIQTTCFAYKDGQCTALKKIACDGCGFYCDEGKNAALLMRYNGTDNIEQACEQYSKRKNAPQEREQRLQRIIAGNI